jgi:SAM-dependent methyltransferase
VKIVDLGCGNAKYQGSPDDEVIGIDSSGDTHADIVCNLGFEEIPLEDSSVDACYAHHFLEHIPESVWFKETPSSPRDYDVRIIEKKKDSNGQGYEIEWREGPNWKEFKPMVFLFNEIYRTLKHEGVLIARVPAFPHGPSVQDPTHRTFWTEEKLNYFSGDYYGFHHLGHTSRFAKRLVERDRYNWEIHFELVAVKDRDPDEPYLLEYEGVDLWKTILRS